MKFTNRTPQDQRKRDTLKVLGIGTAIAGGALLSSGNGVLSKTNEKEWGEHFQSHYQQMTPEEVTKAVERLERRYKEQYKKDIKVGTGAALEGTLFGYALNISKCKGYRKCVTACSEENNQDKEPNMEYIRVLELDQGSMNLEAADPYFTGDVPKAGKIYLPVQCHHCENPPCVKSCPTKATWKEPDGIVVVDYNWCIGCRMCANACPYWARKFNWREPEIKPEQINPDTHYLSNRPREKGVMEKCTFCLQRTRKGEQPACQEACPTGARVFGNLLDPESEIRYVLANKRVFRLKEELNTEPKFWYYAD